MKYISLLILPWSFALPAQAQESDSPLNADYYLFMSGKVSAQVKRDFYPIERFDGKRLRLADLKKPLKPASGLNCSLQPVMVVSKYFADIRDLEFTFDSQAAKLRSMMAINEMNAEQMRQEATTEFENAVAAMNGRRELVSEGDESVAALDELTRDQTEKELLYSGLNKRVDHIFGRSTVVANTDLRNVYAAAVIRFEGIGATETTAGETATFVRVAPIGDLDAGIGRNVKFDYAFPELRATSARIDLFLFNGDSKHIATNLSRGLKAMTTEQFEELRNLERQSGAN